jgi:hypothetical protein
MSETAKPPRVRRFITSAWAADEYTYPQAAILTITPEKAQLVLRLMDALVQLQRTVDSEIYKLIRWDYLAEFIERVDEEVNPELSDFIEKIPRGEFKEVHVLPDESTLGVEWLSTELGFMQIFGLRDFGAPEVTWLAHVKHTDIQMHTLSFPRYVIEAIAEERDIVHPAEDI